MQKNIKLVKVKVKKSLVKSILLSVMSIVTCGNSMSSQPLKKPILIPYSNDQQLSNNIQNTNNCNNQSFNFINNNSTKNGIQSVIKDAAQNKMIFSNSIPNNFRNPIDYSSTNYLQHMSNNNSSIDWNNTNLLDIFNNTNTKALNNVNNQQDINNANLNNLLTLGLDNIDYINTQYLSLISNNNLNGKPLLGTKSTIPSNNRIGNNKETLQNNYTTEKQSQQNNIKNPIYKSNTLVPESNTSPLIPLDEDDDDDEDKKQNCNLINQKDTRVNDLLNNKQSGTLKIDKLNKNLVLDKQNDSTNVNNRIFNVINTGKYDNIKDLFTTNALNSITDKQVEQLKLTMGQIQQDEYVQVKLDIIKQIKDNITLTEDNIIKSLSQDYEEKDYQKLNYRSSQQAIIDEFNRIFLEICQSKFCNIFKDINNTTCALSNQLTNIFIHAYADQYRGLINKVIDNQTKNRFSGIKIVLSKEEFYDKTLPLVHTYCCTKIFTEELRNKLHNNIFNNILRYYRFLHLEIAGLSNQELQQKQEVMTFVKQLKQELQSNLFKILNTLNKLRYPVLNTRENLKIINNENMAKHINNPLNNSFIMEDKTHRSIKIDGIDLGTKEDETWLVILKDEHFVLADLKNNMDQVTGKPVDGKPDEMEIINTQYQLKTNEINQFKFPTNITFTNALNMRNALKPKPIYDMWKKSIEKSIKESKNELRKAQYKKLFYTTASEEVIQNIKMQDKIQEVNKERRIIKYSIDDIIKDNNTNNIIPNNNVDNNPVQINIANNNDMIIDDVNNNTINNTNNNIDNKK